MDYITAELFELTSFFEAEPTYQFPEDPWPYTDALFECIRADLSITFALHPAYRDVRIILRLADTPVYEFAAQGIIDVRYHQEKSGERLECQISDAQTLSIWTRPTIRITETVTETT